MNKEHLASIDPSLSKKYSRNLHAWLRMRLKRSGGEYQVWRHNGALYIGYEYEGDVMGNRLMTVLNRGARAELGCWVGLAYDRVKSFWPKYLKLGKCHIDPKHEWSWAETRWKTKGDVRTCLWCGLVQRKRRWVERVNRETWETAKVKEVG